MVDTAQDFQAVNIIGGNWQVAGGAHAHPSKELIRISGVGPLNLIGTGFTQQDGQKYHIVLQGDGYGFSSRVTFLGSMLRGNSAWAGRRAQQTARLCGPYKVSSGDTLTIKIDGGATQTITLTADNFTAAGVTHVDLNEVDSWQVGKLLHYYLSSVGGWAYGEWDNAPPTIGSATEGGGSIQVTGGTGNVYLDFTTGGAVGKAQTNMSKDWYGWIDCHSGADAWAEPLPFEVSNLGSDFSQYYSSSPRPSMPIGAVQYGTQSAPNRVVSGNSLAFTAVTGGAVTVSGADITITDARLTPASAIPEPTPTNAAAVTLGRLYLKTRAMGSVTFTAPSSPAGTETYLMTFGEST